MQASAHTPAPLVLEYTGTIAHAPQARTRLLDGTNSVPVLVLDVELDCATRNIMQVQQPYPVGAHQQAALDAKRWRVGDRITVQASLLDLRMVVANATCIRTAPMPTPLPNPTPIPDLFGA